MTTNCVVIGYENVIAGNLNLLAGGSHTFEALIFVGPLYAKIPVDLAIQPKPGSCLGSGFAGALVDWRDERSWRGSRGSPCG